MEFKQLEAFVAVVENKSFSEAARQLNLTQPTISAHIQSLEQELNSRLLIRTTKKLTITQRGLQLYDCASNILNMRSNIIEEFTGINKKIVDLAVSTIPSSYLLPEILSAFTCQIPDVYFHSWQSDSLGAVSRVLDGSVDLALVGNTFEEPDCCFIPFRTDKLVIATPVNEHYLKYQEKADLGTLDFSDFLDEPFIMRESGSGTKKEIDRYLESHNIPDTSLHVVNERSGSHPQVCGRRTWHLHFIRLLRPGPSCHTPDSHVPSEPRKGHAYLLHRLQQKPHPQAPRKTVLTFRAALLSITSVKQNQGIHQSHHCHSLVL